MHENNNGEEDTAVCPDRATPSASLDAETVFLAIIRGLKEKRNETIDPALYNMTARGNHYTFTSNIEAYPSVDFILNDDGLLRGVRVDGRFAPGKFIRPKRHQ